MYTYILYLWCKTSGSHHPFLILNLSYVGFFSYPVTKSQEQGCVNLKKGHWIRTKHANSMQFHPYRTGMYNCASCRQFIHSMHLCSSSSLWYLDLSDSNCLFFSLTCNENAQYNQLHISCSEHWTIFQQDNVSRLMTAPK